MLPLTCIYCVLDSLKPSTFLPWISFFYLYKLPFGSWASTFSMSWLVHHFGWDSSWLQEPFVFHHYISLNYNLAFPFLLLMRVLHLVLWPVYFRFSSNGGWWWCLHLYPVKVADVTGFCFRVFPYRLPWHGQESDSWADHLENLLLVFTQFPHRLQNWVFFFLECQAWDKWYKHTSRYCCAEKESLPMCWCASTLCTGSNDCSQHQLYIYKVTW